MNACLCAIMYICMHACLYLVDVCFHLVTCLIFEFCFFFFSSSSLEMNLWGLIAGGAMVLGPRPRGKKRSPEEDEDE